MYKNPLLQIDFYKADHRRQYPAGTTKVYSNLTARNAKHANILNKKEKPHIIFFGLQYFILDFLIEKFTLDFFGRMRQQVIKDYKDIMDNSLGKGAISTEHIEQLHDLGYLPLKIKALPEGARVPVGVPVLTITNTHPDFYWLVNYFETVLSAYIWKPTTSATTAFEYAKLTHQYANITCDNKAHLPFQCHDFSFRGMSGTEDAASSGAGHLLSFNGTDTVSAIEFLQNYYEAPRNEMIGCSVPATEHSVMCMGEQEGEINTFKRLITELYPSGIVSIVSDTWDYWKVITEYLPTLKEDILKREGKVVIRPDSGDPVKIICGDPDAPEGSPEALGTIQCLYRIFGGIKNKKGYIELDSHIGAIYGDSITLERAEKILSELKKKGFASNNIVFGVGSFTYNYVTRDNFSFAVKATYGEVNGKGRNIHKNPKTDAFKKKSAKGLLKVELNRQGEYVLHDEQTEKQEGQGELKTVYLDGELKIRTSLDEIRTRIKENLK